MINLLSHLVYEEALISGLSKLKQNPYKLTSSNSIICILSTAHKSVHYTKF